MAGISTGTVIGSYEVLALLGRGGMGEVYRARDSKLKREVAIKSLPDEFSRDPERLARFQREAEALAALNHPNIGGIYHLQDCEQSRYLVLELVEGDTLAEILAKRRLLSVDEALHIAKQICDALEAAHEKGITHRDLKPGNIKITPDGKAKLLDFGLARAFQSAGETNLSNSPTLMSGSIQGMILGTASYMSPEQARGGLVDRRTDIWAFGCVLYEMLLGAIAFPGTTVSDVIANVLKSDPTIDPSQVPHAELRKLIRRCLAKDPQRRFHDIADVRLELDEMQAPSTENVQPPTRRRAIMPWLIAAVSLVIAFFLLAERDRKPDATPRPVRFSLSPPEGRGFSNVQYSVSTDGTRVVFGAVTSNGGRSLWIRSLDSLTPQQLQGTEGGSFPFWSPDGRFIAFFAQRKLKKVKIGESLPAEALCDATDGLGTWNQEGTILFSNDEGNSGINRVSANGGAVSAVTNVDTTDGEISHHGPEFLPDGVHFLYLVRSSKAERSGIYVGSLQSPEKKQLVRGDANAAYVAPGYLLFTAGGTLYAQKFNASKLSLTGDATSIVGALGYNPAHTKASFSASTNGVLAYRQYVDGTQVQPVWFDRQGKEIGSLSPPGDYRAFRLSPNDKSLAVSVMDNGRTTSIWVFDLARSTLSRITSGRNEDNRPIWSPDGSHLAFAAFDTAGSKILSKSADGVGDETTLIESSGSLMLPQDWDSENTHLLYRVVQSRSASVTGKLWVVPIGRPDSAFAVFNSAFDESDGKFSPDGKWLAYVSNETGRAEVFVQSFPAGRGRWRVSTEGGTNPRWRADGKELFYMSGNGVTAAKIDRTGDGSLDPKLPETLFVAPIAATANYTYDVTADGARFIINVGRQQQDSHMDILLNLASTLPN